MNSRLCNVAVAILWVAIVVLNVENPSAHSGMELLPSRVDLPSMTEGEKRSVAFTIRNSTREAKLCRIQTSCSCSAGPKGDLRVSSGDSVVFEVTVDTNLAQGPNMAAIQVLDDAGKVCAQSWLTFASEPEVLIEPEILSVPASGSAKTVAYVLGRPFDRLEAIADHGAPITVVAKRRNRRAWDLEIRRLPVRWEHAGVVAVELLSEGRRVGRVYVGLSNQPWGLIRCGMTARSVSPGMWSISCMAVPGDAIDMSYCLVDEERLAMKRRQSGLWDIVISARHAGKRAKLVGSCAGAEIEHEAVLPFGRE